jgi:hypothetical protein
LRKRALQQREYRRSPKTTLTGKGGRMLPEKQKQAYEAFFESTENNGIIEPKATLMIQLAASLAIGCYP